MNLRIKEDPTIRRSTYNSMLAKKRNVVVLEFGGERVILNLGTRFKPIMQECALCDNHFYITIVDRKKANPIDMMRAPWKPPISESVSTFRANLLDPKGFSNVYMRVFILD